MGSILSNMSAQSVAVVVVIVGTVTYTVVQRVLVADTPSKETTPTPTLDAAGSSAGGKKGKKKKGGAALQSDVAPTSSTVKPTVVSFPAVIPGGFDSPAAASGQEQAESTSSKPTKAKKKKSKKSSTPVLGGGARSVPQDAQSESSATAPESHAPAPKPAKKKSPTPKPPSVSLVDTDDTWTRVEPRRRTSAQPGAAAHSRDTSGALGSDVATSATGNSSPVTERTEDESHASVHPVEHRRTLAEKMLPKPRKTGVDDMLETPDYPTVARVMRVQPQPNEQPAAGFSWGDYEDVDDPRTADDADGEDEGGWVVKTTKSRLKPTRSASSEQQAQAQRAPESMTKKQRQNAAKRDAQKSAKADAEAERLALLAKHKRELERAKIQEQASASKSKVGGGMTASMNEKGHLVWD